ncbi:MAG: hypothetical protein AB7S26_14900 [Sandaracinaceae bacterium]
MGAVAEFFFLRGALAAAKGTPEDQRRAVSERRQLATQRAQAAEALWAQGHLAEGLRMANEALSACFDALAALDESAEATSRAGMERAGMDADEMERAIALDRERQELVLPTLDARVTDVHVALYRRLAAASTSILRALGAVAQTPQDLSRARAWRLGVAVLIALAIVIAGVVIYEPPSDVTAEASGTWSPTQGLAAFAIDGRPETEWMLPDRQPGWLEIRFASPRHIAALRMLNGHNPGYNDRAIRTAHVELFAGDRSVAQLDVDWPRVEPAPEWIERYVDVDGVDRVRVEARTFHSMGTALAEIQFDE